MSRITPACAGKRQIDKAEKETEEDHPRVCGEKWNQRYCFDVGEGSPPRVRGKALYVVLSFLNVRITPACAGKSAFRFQSDIQKKDHPRVCGEKACKD